MGFHSPKDEDNERNSRLESNRRIYLKFEFS